MIRRWITLSPPDRLIGACETALARLEATDGDPQHEHGFPTAAGWLDDRDECPACSGSDRATRSMGCGTRPR